MRTFLKWEQAGPCCSPHPIHQPCRGVRERVRVHFMVKARVMVRFRVKVTARVKVRVRVRVRVFVGLGYAIWVDGQSNVMTTFLKWEQAGPYCSPHPIYQPCRGVRDLLSRLGLGLEC